MEEKLTKHAVPLREIQVDLKVEPLKTELTEFDKNKIIAKDRGRLIILSARTGNGKTALASQIALNVAKTDKVLYFSLEMTKESLKERFLATVSGVPIENLTYKVNEPRLKQAEEMLNKLNLEIIDDPSLTINHLLAKSYDEAKIDRPALIIVDYIGLLSKDTSGDRHKDISAIAMKLKKQLAEKLNIPVLALAQMNQGIDARIAKAKEAKAYDKEMEVRPMLSDMGESKGIADWADIVLFLLRPCTFDARADRKLINAYVAKNRNGKVFDLSLHFNEDTTQFKDWKGEEEWV